MSRPGSKKYAGSKSKQKGRKTTSKTKHTCPVIPVIRATLLISLPSLEAGNIVNLYF